MFYVFVKCLYSVWEVFEVSVPPATAPAPRRCYNATLMGSNVGGAGLALELSRLCDAWMQYITVMPTHHLFLCCPNVLCVTHLLLYSSLFPTSFTHLLYQPPLSTSLFYQPSHFPFSFTDIVRERLIRVLFAVMDRVSFALGA